MKKCIKLIAGLTFLAGILSITSCGLKKTLLDDTQDQWYKYNGTVEIPIGKSDNSENDTLLDKLTQPEFYVYFNEDDGLTVAIQSDYEQDINLFCGLYSTTTKFPVGGYKQYTPEEFGTVKWTALIALGDFKKCSEPGVVKGNQAVNLFNDLKKGGIQWKKVLKNILLESLLGE